MELRAGLVVADRFRLVRLLGQGGMGAVWLAQHTGLDIQCAVKFIHEDAARSPEVRGRFEREAKAAAQLRSPHVVQILDHGVWEGTPYIAMEYLEGEDLGQRLRRKSPLPPREVLAIAVHIGRALTKAQAAGLVHRDLKPNNVFLVPDEEREIAKVLDFGVAKIMETNLDEKTKTGALLGTPFYMSPEQARGKGDIDHRSDLWSLAVLVYRCLVGRLPFQSDNLGDLLMRIMVEPPPVPSQIADVPAGFDAWWARAVERDPARRFQSARELTDALGFSLGLSLPWSPVTTGDPQRVPQAPPDAGERASVPPVTPSMPSAPVNTLAFPTPAPLVTSIGPTVPPILSSGGEAPRSRVPVAAVVAGAVALVAVGGLGLFLGSRGRSESPALAAPTSASTGAPAPAAPTSASPSTSAPAASTSAPAPAAPPIASTVAQAPRTPAKGDAPKRPAGKGGAPAHPAATVREDYGF